MKGENKSIKKVERGNCVINFVEQHGNCYNNDIDIVHKLVAELLLKSYIRKQKATS